MNAPAKTRLLVVDDDRIILATLVAGLSKAGFDVVVAGNADEAMKLAVDVQPALARSWKVAVEMRMAAPIGPGRAACRRSSGRWR